jgi:hypothetical protein
MLKGKSNRRWSMIVGALIVLCIPALAMLFTNEVSWGPFDFVIAAILLLALIGLVEWVLLWHLSRKWTMIFLGIAILVVFLIWAELAVGLFDTPWSGS